MKEQLQINLENAETILRNGLEWSIGNYQWLPEYDKIVSWLSNNEKKGLICMGSYGRGKTVICKKIFPVIFNTYLKKNYLCYDAIEINDKADEIKCTIPTLIDDIGIEGEKNNFGDRRIIFPEILDAAEKNGQLLILTTNLSPTEIIAKYGERCWDRLRSLCKGVIFNGESLRNG